jgi:hypothetical protein
MPRQDLESRLAELTRVFVTRLVQEIRNASFAEVAALPDAGTAATHEARGPTARASRAASPKNGQAPRTRRSAQGRAELAERVIAELNGAGKPLGVRELSSALGVSADALGAPLRELRASGKIRKHGDKRATKYSEA